MTTERRFLCRPWHQDEIDRQMSEIRNYLAKSSMVVSLLGPRFASEAVRDIDARKITFIFSKPDHVPPLLQVTSDTAEVLGPVQSAADCCNWVQLNDLQADLEQAFEFAKNQLLGTDVIAQSVAAGGPASFLDKDGVPWFDRSYFLDEVSRLFALLLGFRAERLGVPVPDSIRDHFAGVTGTAGEMVKRISEAAEISEAIDG